MAGQVSVETMLQRLYEEDRDNILREQTKLDRVYTTLPKLIEDTAELMGISAERLARLAKHTTFLHQNVTWYEVVSILHSFHVSQKNLE
jgi:hypothetical protein